MDQVAPGHEQQKARRRVGRGRHEHIDQFLAGVRLDLAAGRPGHEADGADATARVLDQDHLPKRAGLLGEHGFEDLLERAVDAAHHRHTREQPLAEAHQGAAGEPGGQHADQGEERQYQQQSQTRQAEGQIILGIVARGQQSGDVRVKKGQELPHQVDRDADRRGDDDSGQKVGAQAADQARGLVRLDRPKTWLWPGRIAAGLVLAVPVSVTFIGPRCCDRRAGGSAARDPLIKNRQRPVARPASCRRGCVAPHEWFATRPKITAPMLNRDPRRTA